MIYTKVSKNSVRNSISIDGGEGVGRVTKTGLDQPVGNAAINSTPLELIEKRIKCVALCDMYMVLYNPSSKKRSDYLRRACDIMLKYKPADTVCGIVQNIGRNGEAHKIMLLSELCEYATDMFTTVFIGNCKTKNINGKMVTPRVYKYE